MENTIVDLLESAKILAKVNGDQMLGYLIEMALVEAREGQPASAKAKKAA